jgi:hypothetical protein
MPRRMPLAYHHDVTLGYPEDRCLPAFTPMSSLRALSLRDRSRPPNDPEATMHRPLRLSVLIVLFVSLLARSADRGG